MNLVIGFIGSMLTVAAVIAGAWWWHRRHQEQLRLTRQKAVIAADQRKILDLMPGDVVELDGLSLLIETTLLYDEQGSIWAEHRAMQDLNGLVRWLSVADDDHIAVALFELLPRGTVDVSWPPPQTLQVGGVGFNLREHGSARVRKRDALGLRDHGRCDYADYVESGRDRDGRLSLERWGNTIEVALGRTRNHHDLLILPGSSS